MGEALREDVFPLFRTHWRAKTGHDVDLLDSFAASGTIANQIVNGTPADIAIFSHPGDADRVVEGGRATRDWRLGPNGGILNRTPMVIAVRKGNPKGVASFADLGRPGLDLVHPDPLTSGGAKWGILAEYAEPIMNARSRGREPNPEAAYTQLLSIWRNVKAQAPSARAAKTQFDKSGIGDALVTYEVETLMDAPDKRPEVVVPRTTILCEHPVVLVDKNIGAAERPAVEEFLRFLFTEDAQRAFVKHGFRSIFPALDKENGDLGPLENAYTVESLGGWREADRAIVEAAWKGRVLAEASR